MIDTLTQIFGLRRLKGLRRVGTARRKTKGKVYESPRITLSSETKGFIGRRFSLFKARAEETLSFPGDHLLKLQGDVLILFFQDERGPLPNRE